jgi:hypothetical protein
VVWCVSAAGGVFACSGVTVCRVLNMNKHNLGCLHPVARVISDDMGFNPSTQRHYRRLIYYLYIYIHVAMYI